MCLKQNLIDIFRSAYLYIYVKQIFERYSYQSAKSDPTIVLKLLNFIKKLSSLSHAIQDFFLKHYHQCDKNYPYKISLQYFLKTIKSVYQFSKKSDSLISFINLMKRLQRKEHEQHNLKIGICSLDQGSLDFKRNYDRIVQSIQRCKQLQCMLRVGSQLEISGYYCADHFCQYETIHHCWDIIRDILVSGVTNGIVTDIGCPVLHKAALYNCRVILYNSKVVGIRAKMIMADGDNYFETRYFACWKENNKIDEFFLPMSVQQVTGQTTVPIGIFIINFNDTRLAYEICEQAWISRNPMIEAALDGAQIFINPSASFIQRGKLQRKIQMITEFTQRHGGAYAYVNGKGTSGQRTYMDGGCIFSQNGQIKFLSDLSNLEDIQITTAIANIDNIRTFRLSNKSFQKQSNCVNKIPRIFVDVNVAIWDGEYFANNPDHVAKIERLLFIYNFPHVTYEPSLWLWSCLKKSGASGFYLSLSGSIDSCAVALVVYNMCVVLCNEIMIRKSKQILRDLRKVLKKSDYIPTTPEKLCRELMHTVHIANELTDDEKTKRAKTIAQNLGFNHRQVRFQDVFQATRKFGQQSSGTKIKFKAEGGNDRTDLSLQNVQARLRMALTYFLAGLQMEIKDKQGFLLVLGTSNLDEALRGYFTKYDCSSADYNPIGSFSRVRLRQFLQWNRQIYGFDFITSVLNAGPSSQLRPIQEGQVLLADKQDMGFTYEEIRTFGYMRKIEKLGPVTMFDRLLSMRKFTNVSRLAEKIKAFFLHYGKNRHKMASMTPTFHYDPQGCDDNRFDMRPVIYETDWSYQFAEIDFKLKGFLQKHPSQKFIAENKKKIDRKSTLRPEEITPSPALFLANNA